MRAGIEEILEEQERWEQKQIQQKGVEIPPVSNSSGIPIKVLYTPLDGVHPIIKWWG